MTAKATRSGWWLATKQIGSRAVSSPIKLRVFTEEDTIFTAGFATEHGATVQPDSAVTVEWSPGQLHRYHQEEWEQDLGVRRTAKNVRFELVGESFDTQGRMVDRTTYHGPFTTDETVEKTMGTYPNTGKAVLSFPSHATGIWKGHRFYLVIKDAEDESSQGWSRGYFRFAQTLAGNDLSMLDVTSLVVNKASLSGFRPHTRSVRPWLPHSMPKHEQTQAQGHQEGAWQLRRQRSGRHSTSDRQHLLSGAGRGVVTVEPKTQVLVASYGLWQAPGTGGEGAVMTVEQDLILDSACDTLDGQDNPTASTPPTDMEAYVATACGAWAPGQRPVH